MLGIICTPPPGFNRVRRSESVDATAFVPNVSISSGQRNLMKTYHNDANSSKITKIALKKILDFF